MIKLIESRRRELEKVCSEYGVQTLEVFGSAVSDAFDPSRSDLDFLVAFRPDAPRNAADRYFGLREALSELFGCSVDLVMAAALRNRYFIESVNRTRQLLYAA